MTDAYIYDAIRTPRGKGRKDGALHEVTSVRLSSQMLDALADRNGLSGHAVEDVIWGNVTPIGEQVHALPARPFWPPNLTNPSPVLRSTAFVPRAWRP